MSNCHLCGMNHTINLIDIMMKICSIMVDNVDSNASVEINIIIIITLWYNIAPRVCEQPAFTAQQNYNYYNYLAK